MLSLKNVIGTGTPTKTVYLYPGALLIATVSGSTTSYFHDDHLDDTRLVKQNPPERSFLVPTKLRNVRRSAMECVLGRTMNLVTGGLPTVSGR